MFLHLLTIGVKYLLYEMEHFEYFCFPSCTWAIATIRMCLKKMEVLRKILETCRGESNVHQAILDQMTAR